jgi:hypothetical protein
LPACEAPTSQLPQAGRLFEQDAGLRRGLLPPSRAA